MSIIKQFTYSHQSHTVTVESSIKGTVIRLDGVPCPTVQDTSKTTGGLSLECVGEIEGDRLTICVFRKEIYIFKGDREIESGLQKHPKKHLHWAWSALSKLCVLPLLGMIYLVYSDSPFNIHRFTDSTAMTVKLCAVIWGVILLFYVGSGKCSYYLQHPIAPIQEKQKGIVLWTFLTIFFSTAWFLLAHYWILS